MRSDADATFLSDIRARTLDALASVLGGARQVAIIDAPNQRNVGDSLIWAGELAYLARLGVRIAYVADLWTYDQRALRKTMPSGVVLLHGGGNFGDLWIGHQILREIVVGDLPDYRVVQLPQSIYFQDAARGREANRILGSHRDFHVLVRDEQSVAAAARHLPDVHVIYCPDMALGWDPKSVESSSRQRRALLIARRDKEAASGLAEVGDTWLPSAQVTITDWRPRGYSGFRWRLARALSRAYRLFARARRRFGHLPTGLPDRVGAIAVRSINYWNVRGAEDLYRKADIIVVDRLHAHILAGLLSKPHVVLDNNYGKVSGIYREYSGELSTAHYASDLDDARRQTERLLGVA